jgi:hypothetical protein
MKKRKKTKPSTVVPDSAIRRMAVSMGGTPEAWEMARLHAVVYVANLARLEMARRTSNG